MFLRKHKMLLKERFVCVFSGSGVSLFCISINRLIYFNRISNTNTALRSSSIRRRPLGRRLRRSRHSIGPDMSVGELLRMQIDGHRSSLSVGAYLPGKTSERVSHEHLGRADQARAESPTRHSAQRNRAHHQELLAGHCGQGLAIYHIRRRKGQALLGRHRGRLASARS